MHQRKNVMSNRIFTINGKTLVQGSPEDLEENQVLIYRSKTGELKLYELGELGFPVLASNGALEVIGKYKDDFSSPAIYEYGNYPVLVSRTFEVPLLRYKNIALPIYKGKFLLKNFPAKDIIEIEKGLDMSGLNSRPCRDLKFATSEMPFTTNGGLTPDFPAIIKEILSINPSVCLCEQLGYDIVTYTNWDISGFLDRLSRTEGLLHFYMKRPFTKFNLNIPNGEKLRRPYGDIEWLLTYPHLVTRIKIESGY